MHFSLALLALLALPLAVKAQDASSSGAVSTAGLVGNNRIVSELCSQPTKRTSLTKRFVCFKTTGDIRTQMRNPIGLVGYINNPGNLFVVVPGGGEQSFVTDSSSITIRPSRTAGCFLIGIDFGANASGTGVAQDVPTCPGDAPIDITKPL